MGFWRTVALLHAVAAVLLALSVPGVFILPRLSSPGPGTQIGCGGITHNSFFLQFVSVPHDREACRGKCVGPWVKVAWRPVEPTPDELLELDKLPDKSFDSGYFQPLEADDFNVLIPLTGLRPDTEYEYRAYQQLSAMMRGEHGFGRFRTLAAPRAQNASAFSFVFGSCMLSRAWPFDNVDLIDTNQAPLTTLPVPAFAVLMGDNVYVDAPPRLEPRMAYRQLLESRSFRKLNWYFPTFFAVDDHEIRNDADDIDSEEFLNATREYDLFLGRRNTGTTKVRYHSFWNGRVAFVLLDTRSHRSPKVAPDTAAKTILGARQKAFLQAWAEETKDAAVRFVMSPVAWSASVTGGDGWHLYLTEREEVLDWLANGPKTVLLSGDLHFAMIIEIRAGMYEVSVSPISSVPLRAKIGALQRGERLVASSQLKQHFGRIDVGTQGEVDVSVYSEIPRVIAPRLQMKHRI
jgi:phosphodiesterase/alkaline phosphatase D-like protein